MSDWNEESARWYVENYGEYATNRLAIDALELADDEVIVDIGCGAGPALRHAAHRVTKGTLVGIDPVPYMVDIARQRAAEHPAADRIEFAMGFAHALPLEDDFATLILAFDSFDYWEPHTVEGLAEVRRVLKPGGRFVVVKDGGVPDAGTFADKLRSHDVELELLDCQDLAQNDIRLTMWMFGDC